MKYYSKRSIHELREKADIREYIPGNPHNDKKSYYVECPYCKAHGKNKGLCVTYGTDSNGKLINMAKCFSCNKGFADAIMAVQFYKGLKYYDALEYVAEQEHFALEVEKDYGNDSSQNSVQSQKKGKEVANGTPLEIPKETSFCYKQLESSGLVPDDVMVELRNEEGKVIGKVCPFVSGGYDEKFNINPKADEMLIYYYDLWGQMAYYTKSANSSKQYPYARVRWSNPSLHEYNGKQAKYQSPAGASAKLYIPQFIRSKFLAGEEIETLIVQEGEKKAEKACKHGLPSIGIQGIFNIGSKERGVIQDLQYLIQKCHVKKIVLLFDSDWNALSSNLTAQSRIEKRPMNFAIAAVNFKNYIFSMHQIGIDLDVYFGHINKSDSAEKGIDDLLCGCLKGKEDDFVKDFYNAMSAHNGFGKYVDVHKITAISDNKIYDFWKLNSADEFFSEHSEELKDLQFFQFKSLMYRRDGDTFVIHSTHTNNFWSTEKNDKGRITVNFDSAEAMEVINDEGFRRIHTADMPIDIYRFVRVKNNIVDYSGPTEIRDYIYNYMLESVKEDKKEVVSAFTSRLGKWLGYDVLERVRIMKDDFDIFEPFKESICYENGQVTITPYKIDISEQILNQVWRSKVLPRKFKKYQIFKSIEKVNDMFYINLTEDGEKCEYLRFLMNTCRYNTTPINELSPGEIDSFVNHLVNKITTIGYLLSEYKYLTELKAVVAMDTAMSEVGQSNGRSGKSLIGMAIAKMTEQAYIDGRGASDNDQFLYSAVNYRTRNVFIDDIKANFDFQRFFGSITGDLVVNFKGGRFTIPLERSPKFYLTTNHAINADDTSTSDRIIYMAFSDYYNDENKPIDEFGHAFFQDWDDYQWNLFDSLMCECIMYYQRSMSEAWSRKGVGAIQPPMTDIKLRTLRQLMGEAFLQWAETYFDASNSHLNCRIIKKDMFDNFKAAFPDAKYAATVSNFKKKVIYYCKYKGLHFNPMMTNKKRQSFSIYMKSIPKDIFIGDRDSAGGVEYISVWTTEFAKKQAYGM